MEMVRSGSIKQPPKQMTTQYGYSLRLTLSAHRALSLSGNSSDNCSSSLLRWQSDLLMEELQASPWISLYGRTVGISIVFPVWRNFRHLHGLPCVEELQASPDNLPADQVASSSTEVSDRGQTRRSLRSWANKKESPW